MFLQRGDLKRVMAGIRRIDHDLQMLRLDYGPEARGLQLIYVGKILRHTRDLELHLHVALINNAMAGSQCGSKRCLPAMDGLHRAFFSMNPALRHLQKIEMRARNGNPGLGLFDALDGDWRKFKKAAFKAINLPMHAYRRTRHLSWSSERDGDRGQTCSLS